MPPPMRIFIAGTSRSPWRNSRRYARSSFRASDRAGWAGVRISDLKERVDRAMASARKVSFLRRRGNRGYGTAIATIVEVGQPPDTEGSKYPEPQKLPLPSRAGHGRRRQWSEPAR